MDEPYILKLDKRKFYSSLLGLWTKAEGMLFPQEKRVMGMVKVIRYGNKRRVTCGVCESFLEYEKEDVKTVQTGMNGKMKSFVRIAGRRSG